ncbi:MAG: transcriptional regulator PpsR [Gemmatimonadales bacterium]|nr:MAG: transcriptional regulator PpsR [Gemmatimonadales bacterium]
MTSLFRPLADAQEGSDDSVLSRMVRGACDLALHVSAEGDIHEVYADDALGIVPRRRWPGQNLREIVTSASRGKIDLLLGEASSKGTSRARQVNHSLPGGGEIPVSYTLVRMDQPGHFLALGRNLQALSELQEQLVEAQQALERDYWRLRQVETRYRILFQRSREAVLVVQAEGFRILDANRQAGRIFGRSPSRLAAQVFPEDLELDPEVSAEIRGHLSGVRDTGRAQTVRIHLHEGEAWRLEATLVREDADDVLLVHLQEEIPQRSGGPEDGFDLLGLLEAAPDAWVVADREARVLLANSAFVSLVQAGSADEVRGQSLGRWLGRPGADLTVLLANLEKFGEVRLFPTTVHSNLDLSSEVELSAVLADEHSPPCILLLMRDVSRRIGTERENPRTLAEAMEELSGKVGKSSLKELVQHTVGLVEAHYIESALRLTDGNRTAAAEILGVSRQSLYTKLRRYDVDVPEASGGGNGS